MSKPSNWIKRLEVTSRDNLHWELIQCVGLHRYIRDGLWQLPSAPWMNELTLEDYTARAALISELIA